MFTLSFKSLKFLTVLVLVVTIMLHSSTREDVRCLLVTGEEHKVCKLLRETDYI